MSYIQTKPVEQSMSLLDENMLVVTGGITQIGPRIYSGYAPGEEAVLHVKYGVAMTRAWYDSGLFTTLCDIFREDGTPIAVDKRIKNYSCSIWVTSKDWSDSANISLGAMPDKAIEGYFVLKARYYEHWYDRTQTIVELDRKDFHIPLKGEVPPPPPGEEKVPWGWIAAGGGLLALGIIISARR
ncbi:unnamed protein product [marine sediment metagenome]|uniref:Uncharacterized protein n=1 Tax=marine sediment metagenome TaxID=412755 RepID=X1NSL6_9ZZZZ